MDSEPLTPAAKPTGTPSILKRALAPENVLAGICFPFSVQSPVPFVLVYYNSAVVTVQYNTVVLCGQLRKL